jgi:hypothetical protein
MFGFNSGTTRIDSRPVGLINYGLLGFSKVYLILSPELILLEIRNRSF